MGKRSRDKRLQDEVEEFNKLQQTGLVREYQERFEKLSTLMIIRDPHLTDSYLISSLSRKILNL